MSNEIEIKIDKSLTIEENVKNLVLVEIKLAKSLKKLKQISSIYSDEVSEARKNLHVTKAGDVMFIPDMEDSHLINTVKYLFKIGIKLNSSMAKKYVNELKKRGLVSEVLDSLGEFSGEDLDMPYINKGYKNNTFRSYGDDEDDF